MPTSPDPRPFTLVDRPLHRNEAQQISVAIRETPNILGYSPEELLSFGGCLVAENDAGELAGVCVVKRLSRHWSEIAFLIVLPAFRKQGIGSALFDEAFQRLRDRGDTILCVSREVSILRLMEKAEMRFIPEWRMPPAVHLAKMRHYSSFYRFWESFRKAPMYRGQPPFRYAIRENR
ncbi:MAG: GNAT family N-acetyltransferase [Armatimonadota bacterium]